MAFNFKEFFLGSKTFCWCLPVRAGVIVMSFVTIMLAGFLSIVLWFEVGSASLSHGERAAFIIAGLVETLLLVASVLGFAGTIARKQLFVMIYSYFLYFHFLLNFGVAAFFLIGITETTNTDIIKACQEGLRNPDTKDQCDTVLNTVKDVFWGVALILLILELYGAIIVTRYWRQLRGEKRRARASREATQTAFSLSRPKYGSSISDANIELLPSSAFSEYDSYSGYPGYNSSGFSANSTPHSISDGYGDSHWTHEDVLAEEEERDNKALFETKPEAHANPLLTSKSLVDDHTSPHPVTRIQGPGEASPLSEAEPEAHASPFPTSPHPVIRILGPGEESPLSEAEPEAILTSKSLVDDHTSVHPVPRIPGPGEASS